MIILLGIHFSAWQFSFFNPIFAKHFFTVFALYQKEIRNFLNSFIGYVVILVFLVITGLFLWVFPGTQYNIPESGYAGIDGLFSLAPWVFMFLVPAVTMRSLSEEKKSGTLELLLTRPLTEMNIVLAKYFAGMTLVLFSLVPTLLYYISVRMLASPPGNVDSGAVWGSYIGLFFLAAGYTGIGIFASSVTENQVVAFIIAVFLSFFFFAGLDSLSGLEFFSKFDLVLQTLGISSHYASISRGVVDTRDLLYFISLSAFFIYLSHLSIRSRKW